MAETRVRERGTRYWMSAALALAAGVPADAATFQVTNLDDAGPGSLRQAVLDANTAAGADAITFQAGLTGTILLTSGQLAIEDSVDVQGPGPSVLTVSGNDSSRVFYVYDSDAALDVTISGLTLTDGAGSPGGVVVDWGENLTLDNVVVTGGNSPTVGGGIAVLGGDSPDAFSFTLRDSVVTGNSALESGGGLFVDETEVTVLIQNSSLIANDGLTGGGIATGLLIGDVTVVRSTISGNTAGVRGGGIYAGTLYNGSSVTIRQSTISGNSAPDGGGLFVDYLYGSLLLENSTVSGNNAVGEPGSTGGGLFIGYLYGEGGTAIVRHSTVVDNTAVRGGGIFLESGGLSVDHTIVANNVAEVGDDLANGADGRFDVSFSLIENPEIANVSDLGGNLIGQDPQLGPLQNNGGPTQTHLPAAGSPAVNAGDASFSPPPATDQRGNPRVAQGRIDIGSVEVAASTLQLSASAYTVNENGVTVTITVTRTGSTAGAVSVDFFTSPGTAASPADFLAAMGTLTWADGDGAPKSFQVTLVNDLLVEPSETFGVTLTNPQGGAALGAPFVAAVTILDDDEVVSVAEIPTLGDVGKVLLVGLVGLAGFLRLRRREQGGV
jgi:predicted outer membrane repeat protein